MNNYELEYIINKKLNSHNIQDIIPNGLQIEGCSKINKIILGVSICQKLIDICINKNAQAIIVHHGFFWNNYANVILKNYRKRLKSILYNNINLYTWHLPLDLHPSLGNNIQIAKKLNIHITGNISPLVLKGEFEQSIHPQDLYNIIQKKFYRIPLYFKSKKKKKIKSIAWCSGKGQKFIQDASNNYIDAFLTGEVSENTMYDAYENNIHFFSAGHYATERFGIQALGKWIIKKYNLDVEFIEINNPV